MYAFDLAVSHLINDQRVVYHIMTLFMTVTKGRKEKRASKIEVEQRKLYYFTTLDYAWYLAISLDERIHVFSNETEMFLCIPPCKWESRLLLLSSFLSYNIASYRRDYVRDDVKRTSINLGYFLGSIVVIAWKYDSLVHCWDTQVDTDF